MSNKDWIKDLKVGDEVVTQVGLYGGKQITNIIKITPKGFIKTGNGYVFYLNGTERGGDTWCRASLYQLTDKLKKEIKYKKLVNQFSSYDFAKLTMEQLEQIEEIITKEKTE